MELMSLEWHNDVSNKPKLRTYGTFKQSFGTESQQNTPGQLDHILVSSGQEYYQYGLRRVILRIFLTDSNLDLFFFLLKKLLVERLRDIKHQNCSNCHKSMTFCVLIVFYC